MLTGAALQSLVLAAVWAVPLRNITSSEDRRTQSNTPSPSLEPKSTRASVFYPEISSERSLSSSVSSHVHDGSGGVTAVDDEDRTLRWDSSYHTRTADGQRNKALPEESLSETERSPSSDRPSEARDENTPEPEETSLNISLLTSVSEVHQSLKSRAVDVTDVWTEALHLQRVFVCLAEALNVEPSSQDLLTDATMSSEDLPLIFEPLEDVTPVGNSALVSRMSVAMAPTVVTVEDAELMVSMDTEHTSSLSGMLDWPLSWPTSQTQIETTELDGMTENDDVARGITVTSSDVVQIPTSRSKTDTVDVESKEEADEDDGMDSDEEESEEDLTETSMTPPNRPPYSLIPPPPVWMQGNNGLVRSWVELIREKAGYVSGMLAPVGIGLAGALLLVGALYSIRVIHRRRRENIKHQRSRPPREVRSGPDNAMLLADSSEDEF